MTRNGDQEAMEVWKPIKDFEDYEVSDCGRVRNKDGRTLKPYVNHKGYLKVGLFKSGKCHKKRVHRLVAEAFIENPHDYPQVNHKDENKKNNRVDNLEWCTNQQNQDYSRMLRRMRSFKEEQLSLF